MSVELEHNMPLSCFNSIEKLMNNSSSLDSKIPFNNYKEKKLVLGIGLSSQKISCYINGYMLYYKADAKMIVCMFCNKPHYEEQHPCKKNKKVPRKRKHYLPVILRLQ